MTDLGGLSSSLVGGLGQTVGGLESAIGGAGQGALGAVEHVVQPGETVSSIASDHGVSVGAVMGANPQLLHPDIVEAGARLTVPAAQAEPSADLGAATPQASTAPATAAGAPPSSASAAFNAPAPASPGAPPQPGAASSAEPTPEAPSGALLGTGSPLAAGDGPVAYGGSAGLLASAGALLSPLNRAVVDFRLQQQDQLAAPSTPALAPAAAAASSPPTSGALLQALASDPEAAAAFARLLGDGKAAVLAVLTARLAAAPDADLAPLAVALGAEPAAEVDAAGRALPVGVDLAAPDATPRERERIAAASGRSAPETAQAAWIRRCAPAAIAAKGRWGVPAGFTIAHGALASDWGRLAPGNDFFGLLPGAAPGFSRALVALAGASAVAFDSLDHATQAFAGRLRGDGRYATAFRAPHAAGFAARAAAGGLVGDPLYPPAMEAVIEAHALDRFD